VSATAGQTDRQTDRQTGRQTDRQTDRQDSQRRERDVGPFLPTVRCIFSGVSSLLFAPAWIRSPGHPINRLFHSDLRIHESVFLTHSQSSQLGTSQKTGRVSECLYPAFLCGLSVTFSNSLEGRGEGEGRDNLSLQPFPFLPLITVSTAHASFS